MSFEQKRNAERLPLPEPLDATIAGLPGKIVELSAIGAKVEHQEKVAIGGSVTLRFKWRNQSIELKGKIARTQLRSAYPRGMYYESGVKLADSLEEAPEELRELMASLVEPAPVPQIATPEPAPVPEPPPPPPPRVSTPGEDTLRRLRKATERESSLPLSAFEPVEPTYDIDALDFDDAVEEVEEEPELVPEAMEMDETGPSLPSRKPAAAVLQSWPEPSYDLDALDFESPLEEESVALAVEPPEPEHDYIECRLENGAWQRRVVHSLLQPEEGFITLPADDKELDMLCKTYEYADPETRRLIRISLELQATQKQD